MPRRDPALIHPQITVSELLQRWPQTMPVFFTHRTQCVGCYMADFDTLEDVAANYHLSVDDLLRELKNTLSGRPQD